VGHGPLQSLCGAAAAKSRIVIGKEREEPPLITKGNPWLGLSQPSSKAVSPKSP